MSFGMRHLLLRLQHRPTSPYGGWFYLLSQRLGDRKHLLAEPAFEAADPSTSKGLMVDLHSASEITGGSRSSVFTETQGSEGSHASSVLKVNERPFMSACCHNLFSLL
jgi:hypothetical protein